MVSLTITGWPLAPGGRDLASHHPAERPLVGGSSSRTGMPMSIPDRHSGGAREGSDTLLRMPVSSYGLCR